MLTNVAGSVHNLFCFNLETNQLKPRLPLSKKLSRSRKYNLFFFLSLFRPPTPTPHTTEKCFHFSHKILPLANAGNITYDLECINI